MDGAIDVGAVEAAVDGDHLAVEAVQGAEPEVAVLGELGECHVALVRAVEKRADRRGLEEHMWLALGVKLLLAEGLDVECAHEALPGEEMTPERVAEVLLEEESGAHRDPLR